MIDVAIIASIIPERFPLLRRSLVTWQQSIQTSGLKADIFLYVNGAPLNEVLPYLPCGSCIQIEGQVERTGSHIFGYNYWYQAVKAKVYLFTHGEILFPTTTIRTAFEAATDDVFAAFKVFWLPQHMTDHLDDYDWQQPERLEQCEDIYRRDPKEKGEFYWNKDVRSRTDWQSTTTFAYNRATAAKIFPFPDLGHQGFDDPAHAGFRQVLGIRNHTVMEPILAHQWHPQTWNGDADKAVEEAVVLINELQERLGLGIGG